MFLAFLRTKDMQNATSRRLQIIRTHGTMALQPKGVGAHDTRWTLLRFGKQAVDASAKLLCFHVICVATKSFISPGAVWRIGFWIAATAQFREMQIIYALLSKQRL